MVVWEVESVREKTAMQSLTMKQVVAGEVHQAEVD